MSEFHDSPLPPPRWRGARTKGGCGRTLMIVGVGAIGLIGAFCCVWTGLVHATVEDVVGGQDFTDRSSTVPEPLQIAPAPREVLRPDVESLGIDASGLQRDDGPVPGSTIEVRRGLKPMPAPTAGVQEQPVKRDHPDTKGKPRSGPSEEELFGF